MECVWKTWLRRYRVRRLPEILFALAKLVHRAHYLELAKGFEPPTL
jgi:hypothetical protein